MKNGVPVLINIPALINVPILIDVPVPINVPVLIFPKRSYFRTYIYTTEYTGLSKTRK